MSPEQKQALYDYLSTFATENKRRKIEQVLVHRTRYLTVVLEDIYQPQNASAVVRSCECFGIQDLHVIENRNRFAVKVGVTQGAAKWIDIHRYHRPGQNSTRDCLQTLREQGYRLIATTPHRGDTTPDELPLAGKMALMFGTEELGLSEEALNLADEFLRIPMYGFTESFNLSVSVAICLYALVHRLADSGIDWHLSPEEKIDIRLNWIKKIIPRGETLERAFLQKMQNRSPDEPA